MEKYFIKFEEPDREIILLGGILTMVGTGSEMNDGSVITNPVTKQKINHVFASDEVMPRFSILNPEFTYSLPHYQMVAGIYDIFNHICEQYFSGKDDNVSDYIAKGLMSSLLVSSRIANRNPFPALSNWKVISTMGLSWSVLFQKNVPWTRDRRQSVETSSSIKEIPWFSSMERTLGNIPSLDMLIWKKADGKAFL